MRGRAGRENLPGKVIIQTYNPESFPIQYAKLQNYDLFYKTEIELRKQLKYPPFSDIILVSLSGANETEVINISKIFYKMLKQNLTKYNINVFEAIPAPIDKIQNKYRWRIIAKGNVTDEINIVINKCLRNLYEKINIKTTSIYVDINPNNMM